MKILRFITVIFISFTKIFALQFGFTVKDGKNTINEGFLSFGTIPDDTSSKIQSEVLDQLTTFINEELYRRRLEGIDRNSFISEPVMLSALNDGRVLFQLKGESSVFMNIFRMSCKYISPIKNIWKNSIFFYDPMLILNFHEINNYMKEIELVLINPVIVEEDESIYSEILKQFNSSNSSSEGEGEGEGEDEFEDEEVVFISKEDELQNNRCKGSYCNLM